MQSSPIILKYIGGLVQDCSNSSALALANALELLQSLALSQ